MYYCPGCKAELPAGTHFCNRCGFDQTNARIMSGVSDRAEHLLMQVLSQTQPGAETPERYVQQASRLSILGVSQPEPERQTLMQSYVTAEYMKQAAPENDPVLTLQAQATAPLPTTVGMPEQRSPRNTTAWGVRMPNVYSSVPASESIIATSKAAEHWRESWRNRQRAEAGPAASVSRGQASVLEPLLLLQDTILHMRAIIVPEEGEKQRRGADLSFWILIVIMICLIGALGAYILSTYLFSTTGSLAFLSATMPLEHIV